MELLPIFDNRANTISQRRQLETEIFNLLKPRLLQLQGEPSTHRRPYNSVNNTSFLKIHLRVLTLDPPKALQLSKQHNFLKIHLLGFREHKTKSIKQLFLWVLALWPTSLADKRKRFSSADNQPQEVPGLGASRGLKFCCLHHVASGWPSTACQGYSSLRILIFPSPLGFKNRPSIGESHLKPRWSRLQIGFTCRSNTVPVLGNRIWSPVEAGFKLASNSLPVLGNCRSPVEAGFKLAPNSLPVLYLKPVWNRLRKPWSRVWYQELQNPMPVTNRTPCLVCDITQCKSQYR